MFTISILKINDVHQICQSQFKHVHSPTLPCSPVLWRERCKIYTTQYRQQPKKNKKTKKQQQKNNNNIYIYIHINTLISSRFVLRAAVRPGNVMCILITSHVMLCNANGFYLRKWVKDSRSDVKLHNHCNAKPTSLSYITYIVHIML